MATVPPTTLAGVTIPRGVGKGLAYRTLAFTSLKSVVIPFASVISGPGLVDPSREMGAP